MAGWLARATDAFRKPPPPAPEPFRVQCECGDVMTGTRLPAAQRPACRACGRPLFVLPANVYPVTKAKSAQVAPASPNPRSASPRPGSRPAPVAVEEPAPPPNAILVDQRARWITPFRLIVSVIALLGLATGWSLWTRHQQNVARREVIAAHAAGLKALENGDFATAAQHLGRARDAVDLLRRTDEDSEEIRRLAREAIAAYELSDYTLYEVAADCAEELRGARSRFGTRHRDAWIVLDVVIANPEDSQQPCELDLPLTVEGLKLRIEVDSDTIRKAAQREQAGQSARVIFAARMQSVRPGTEQSPIATLVLDGKSAFLWTSLSTYEALGYTDAAEDRDATEALLMRQQKQETTP